MNGTTGWPPALLSCHTQVILWYLRKGPGPRAGALAFRRPRNSSQLNELPSCVREAGRASARCSARHVQHLADAGRKLGARDRLLDQLHLAVDPALVHDGVA